MRLDFELGTFAFIFLLSFCNFRYVSTLFLVLALVAVLLHGLIIVAGRMRLEGLCQ